MHLGGDKTSSSLCLAIQGEKIEKPPQGRLGGYSGAIRTVYEREVARRSNHAYLKKPNYT